MNDSQEIIEFSETRTMMYHFFLDSSRSRFKDVFGTFCRRDKTTPLVCDSEDKEHHMAESVKQRRTALGISRAVLAQAAYVDRRILQLLELNQLEEKEAADRIDRALTALERGEEMPDFKAEVDAKRS